MTTAPNSTRELTAVLLCGGKGERLRPFTDTVPKPMVPLRGKPLLQHLLTLLAGHGLQRFVLCTGHKAEVIEQFVAARPEVGLDIRCVNSGDASMTDRVLDAREGTRGPLLICYGDTLANVDVGALHRAHRESGALATVTLYPLRSPFGIVEVEAGSNRVLRLAEKPVLPHWINIGFIVCEPEALDLMKRKSDLVSFLGDIAARKQLNAYQHRGAHLTINTEKERREAEEEIEFFSLPDGGIS